MRHYLIEKGTLAQTYNSGFTLISLPLTIDQMNELVPPSDVDTLYHQLMRGRANGMIGEELSETELVELTALGHAQQIYLDMTNSAKPVCEKLHGII